MRRRVWVGVDAGKGFHWAVVLDAEGSVLLSRRVENDQADLSILLEEVIALEAEAIWAVDQPGGSAALLLALLWEQGQRVLYAPGVAVDRARDAHRGESKTDARDARLIAELARMRRDLAALEPGEELFAELKLLVGHRRDLVLDQARAVVRLRDALLSLFPGLERALDLRTRGPLVLVSRYQTPGAVRRAGRKRIEAYLKRQGVRNASKLAKKALHAAEAQRAATPAEEVASEIVRELAERALSLKERTAELDGELECRLLAHPLAEVLLSLPGMGRVLGAEFLAAVGDPRDAFASAGHLAAYAGLVPAARDSGKRVGNNRRMRGGNKLLKKVLYQSAFSSLRHHQTSRAFYDRKRREGKKHRQAVVALARRRIDVLWAMMRDGRRFDPSLTA
ncbi:MAG: IS110 family transposase [Actinomycetota bacterium]|nr:IS110 family transposase [Actinomycetota bacterium]